MDELLRILKKKGMLIALCPFTLLKTQPNRILLENSLSHKYADNIKPIAEFLLNEYPEKFEIFVSVLDEEQNKHLIKKGLKIVKFRSFEYYKVAMTSAFFITNSGGYSYLPLKRDQFVINTWHGGGAYKKIGIDAYKISNLHSYELKMAAQKTTAFCATCTRFADVISRALMMPRDIFLEIGMPRNDLLVNGDFELRNIIREKIGLKKGEKLVLFAPTYRRINHNSLGQSMAIDYGIDAERVCEALKKRFGGVWRFAIRLHPQIKNRTEFANNRVIDLTEYEDMQELLLAADVMINDFSSSMWDFMLTGKPCFIFAKDLQDYINTTAVYTPVEEWPFPASTSNEELEQAIVHFDEMQYKNDCEQHYELLGGCETGAATEYVCNYIAKKSLLY